MVVRWMNMDESVANGAVSRDLGFARTFGYAKTLLRREPGEQENPKIERSFFFWEPSMKLFRQCLSAAAALLLASAALAQVTVSGVRFDDSADLRGDKLVLNGAGTRYKAIFKVYAAALYLPRKSGTAQEVLAMPGAKHMTITMLRDIDSSELGKLFSRGMEDNMEKNAFSRLVPGVMRMSQIFSEHKKLNAGDTFAIDWIPGVGTVITVKGASQGEPFKEPEFFNALLRIWLGPNPADWKLKDALLGR